VLATLTLAPLVIALFYSSEFTAAVGVLRWICLGMAVRVLTWPIGYIVVAKNAQTLFLAIEVTWAVINVGLTWWCVDAFGVDGAGIAFLGANFLHSFMVYPIVRRLSGFRWSNANLKLALVCLLLVAGTFTGFQLLQPMVAMAVGLVATITSTWISVRTLTALVSPQNLPARLQRLLRLKRGGENQ
jgi:PST family polysaccharide transporter